MKNFLHQFKNSGFVKFATFSILSALFLYLSNFYYPLLYVSIVLWIYPAIYILTMFIYGWVIGPIRDNGKPNFAKGYDRFIKKYLGIN
jgi:hypothetical protein